MTYKISRFEQTCDQLFICINSGNNPVYLEHFFTADEQLDQAGTIERLVAELELLDEAYVAPLPRVDKLEEALLIPVKAKNITSHKTAIVAERAAKVEEERLQQLENVVNLNSEPLTNNDTLGNTVEVI
jgi:hypothetical protein